MHSCEINSECSDVLSGTKFGALSGKRNLKAAGCYYLHIICLNLRTGDSIKSVDFLKERMEHGFLYFVNSDQLSA